jgi:Aspartyl protease
MGRPARFGNWTTGIGLVALSLICRSAPADTSVAFKMVAGHFVVVPVLVHNQGPFEFVLDTGTNTTVVDTELARLLGLRPIDRVSVISPGDAGAGDVGGGGARRGRLAAHEPLPQRLFRQSGELRVAEPAPVTIKLQSLKGETDHDLGNPDPA